MALVWEKKAAENIYQVKSAGATKRLYTNGVFHSQYNPNYPLGGSIWDLLVLPALLSSKPIGRVLILGLGGGSAVHALRYFLPNCDITAIEIDPIHIQVAKRYFNVKPNRSTRLLQADAITWLKNYKGSPFDFILDDLFLENKGKPERAIDVKRGWVKYLLDHLQADGILSINFHSAKALRFSTVPDNALLAKLFRSRFVFSVPGYDNRIAALFKPQHTRAHLKEVLGNLQKQNGTRAGRSLPVRIRAM